MSGGHWEYKQGWLDYELAEELAHIVKTNHSEELDAFGNAKGRKYPPDVIAKMTEAAITAKRLAAMVHCIDYLVCGDYGPDSFLEAWEEKVEDISWNILEERDDEKP